MKKRVLIITITFIAVSCLVGSVCLIFSQNTEPVINYTNYKRNYFEIKEFSVITDNIYLAPDSEKEIKYYLAFESSGEEELIFTSSNEEVAIVTSEGLVTSKSPGEAYITLKIKDEEKQVKVTVTNLINKMPKLWNKQKDLLTCNKYSKAENDLLDEILASRVEEAGLKTRAGVLAAARFLTLEFPYKIGYFSENGRAYRSAYTNHVDGEGRYYHTGLYLHESRFSKITKKMYGPGTWGCPIYSWPTEASRRNGFDCSGYIAWILLNGGFDPGDIGAGISNILPDMTDLGTKKNLKTSIKNNELKAGDLLSGPNTTGGHIALLMGIRDGKYFVTESLWGQIGYGAIVSTYSSESLQANFVWHIDMDSYYLEDGNYTKDWI